VVSAFQRHWAPHRTDGLADAETRWRIGRVAGLAQGLVASL
jgi:N-acetyl-anhydromuramyl-L-alanine amidase AmpD